MICNECSKRKCKTEPVYNRSGLGRIYTCRSFQAPRSGWSMLEISLGNSPTAVLTALHRVNLQAVETKGGLKVRYAKRS